MCVCLLLERSSLCLIQNNLQQCTELMRGSTACVGVSSHPRDGFRNVCAVFNQTDSRKLIVHHLSYFKNTNHWSESCPKG